MSHINAPSAIVHVIRRTNYVRGTKVERHDILTGKTLPWRIAKRMTHAHNIGLEFVRALGHNVGDIIGVEVSDGTRTLAQWRAMENGLGFTGSSSSHLLTPRKVAWNGKGWN